MGDATTAGVQFKFKSCPSLFIVALSNIMVASVTWLLSSRPQTLFNLSQDFQVYSSGLSSGTTSSDGAKPHELLEYLPSRIESFFVDNGIALGLNVETPEPSGCTEWNNATSPIAADLASFQAELKDYNDRMKAFPGTVKDLREHITTNYSICDTLMLHPEGLKGIFPSGTLTQTIHGLMEPIVPPMRHPSFCSGRNFLMSLDYMVHDFPGYCRRLKRTSRIVLVDMGASLDFHGDDLSPAIYLTNIYQRFGFHFDHIYAFEISRKEPDQVFGRVPKDLFAAYHWINVGVSHDQDSMQNPWNMILDTYNEDDMVVIKLDIDTSVIEVALTQQLLQNPELMKLVDAFYFEHHVRLAELSPYWGGSMSGSLYGSIKLFTDLRRAGIDAHSWV